MPRPTVELTAQPWLFPSPTITQLDTGLTVWHYMLPGQHVASFELLQPIRLTDEPEELEGLATIALHALDEATTEHDDIQELLDLHGAALHASAHLHAARFGGLIPARRLNDFLPLLVEVLTTPSYHQDDLDIHVESQQAAYRTRMSSPNGAAKWAFRQALYSLSQRHGRSIAGSPESLARIARNDVLEWHSRQFSPTGTTLIVAGDLPELRLTDLARWDNPVNRSAPLSPKVQPGKIVLVDVPGAVQATIQLGCRSISRLDPRWPAARLAGHVLAGGFASRLNLELRERLGYTYGVSGGFSPDPSGSILHVGANVRTEVARDSLERMLSALRLDKPITDEELSDAKAYRIGIAPLANETSADISAQAAALAESGLSSSFVNEHTKALSLVNAQDASKVWHELVAPADLTIAIAGDADALSRELKSFNPEIISLG